MRAQFTQFRIPYSQICFEITETTAITSLSKATDFMLALQGLGCRFALDDFGVGVSSFTYLKNLPVDFLKIDGSFVTDMLQNPVNYAMVEAIHRIGHIMGKKTIAESVESLAILEALRTIGVDYAQGFAIARPAIFGQFRRSNALPRTQSRQRDATPARTSNAHWRQQLARRRAYACDRALVRRGARMRKVDELFERYGESHRHPTNEAIHWICVPLITWSVLAALWAAVAGRRRTSASRSRVAFYAWLSVQIAVGMLALFALMVYPLTLLGSNTLVVAVAVFVAGVDRPVRRPRDRRQEAVVLRGREVPARRPRVAAAFRLSPRGHSVLIERTMHVARALQRDERHPASNPARGIAAASRRPPSRPCSRSAVGSSTSRPSISSASRTCRKLGIGERARQAGAQPPDEIRRRRRSASA